MFAAVPIPRLAQVPSRHLHNVRVRSLLNLGEPAHAQPCRYLRTLRSIRPISKGGDSHHHQQRANPHPLPETPSLGTEVGRLKLPPPRGSTGVDKVWEGIAKQLVPEVRHSSDKAQTRAIEAIRRRGIAEQDEADREPHDTIDDGPPVPMSRLFKLGVYLRLEYVTTALHACVAHRWACNIPHLFAPTRFLLT